MSANTEIVLGPATPDGSALERPAEQASAAAGGERLDWTSFADRLFPGRRRHDFAALTAYGARRRARARGVPSGPAALEIWEGEGGATATTRVVGGRATRPRG